MLRSIVYSWILKYRNWPIAFANFVAAISRTNSNQFEFVRLIAATKFYRGNNDFHKNSPCHTRRIVAATYPRDLSQRFVAWRVSPLKGCRSTWVAGSRPSLSSLLYTASVSFVFILLFEWLRGLVFLVNNFSSISDVRKWYSKSINLTAFSKLNPLLWTVFIHNLSLSGSVI